jgi:hypothetical protein
VSDTIWKRVAAACHLLVLLLYLVGGVLLTGLVVSAFGLTGDVLYSLNWVQILRPPIIVSVLSIWVPLPIGMTLARKLFHKASYASSILVSLLTPLCSLLLLGLGVMLVLLPLGR